MVAPLRVTVRVLQSGKGLVFALTKLSFEGGHRFGDISGQSKSHAVQTVMALAQEDIWLSKHFEHVAKVVV